MFKEEREMRARERERERKRERGWGGGEGESGILSIGTQLLLSICSINTELKFTVIEFEKYDLSNIQ